MKIDEYIERNQLTVRLAMVPPTLLQKFNMEDDVEYFANTEDPNRITDESRIVGKCAKRGVFTAWKLQAIKTGEIGKDYPDLDSW